MKFRISQWLDTRNLQVDELPVLYGIQANIRGVPSGWMHVAEEGEALIFSSIEAADEKLEQLRSRFAE